MSLTERETDRQTITYIHDIVQPTWEQPRISCTPNHILAWLYLDLLEPHGIVSCEYQDRDKNTCKLRIATLLIKHYNTDFTKWDRFFIGGWPALTLASPSLARAQARRDRRRIGCAQRMKWARAPTRLGPGKYTRPNPTWACTQHTVWRLTWMLWTICHLAGLARLALGKTGRSQLDHIQHHLNSSELI